MFLSVVARMYDKIRGREFPVVVGSRYSVPSLARHNDELDRLPPQARIVPRPGIIPHKNATQPTAPYISTEAEVQVVDLPGPTITANNTVARSLTQQPSFIIIACDGVWDEMTSEEAVETVGELLSQYPRNTSSAPKPGSGEPVNIAELFIERVLEQVVERLRETEL